MNMIHPKSFADANCADGRTNKFFPTKGRAQVEALRAKRECLGLDGLHSECPRLNDCLEYALENRERYGVWGGKSERERARIRRERRAAAAAPVQLELIHGLGEESVDDKAARFKAAAERKNAPGQRPRRAEGAMARWADTKKDSGRLLPRVKQHLLAQPQDVDRQADRIHVSELIDKEFCPRATAIRIRRVRDGKPIPKREAPAFQLDNIFDEGNTIHEKWQRRFWQMGVLWGQWTCQVCGGTWWGISPKHCPDGACQSGADVLRYREVPLRDDQHLLVGHADGEIHDADGNVLIEIKSLGFNSVRIELPEVAARHTHVYTDDDGEKRTYVDHDQLWRDLRRPFGKHVRQTCIYLYLRGLLTERQNWPEVKKVVFIYEYKPTQAVKEFVVGLDEDYVAEALEDCKDIAWNLDRGTTPMCKDGRRNRCVACKELDVLEDADDHQTEPAATARGGDPAREGEAGDAEPAATPTPLGRTRIARRPDRAGGRGPDGTARSPHSLGRLLGRAAGDGGR